jgi:hypothetical protein
LEPFLEACGTDAIGFAGPLDYIGTTLEYDS